MKNVKWKNTVGSKHEEQHLVFECYSASIYKDPSGWGGDVEGSNWDQIKYYKPRYKTSAKIKELIQKYIERDLKRREKELSDYVEQLNSL